MKIARILPTFTHEPSLRGERVRIISTPDHRGEVRALLLGKSTYIQTKTDGYVILSKGEYELI